MLSWSESQSNQQHKIMSNNIQEWVDDSPEPTVNMVDRKREDVLYLSSILHIYKKDSLVVMTMAQLDDLLKLQKKYYV